MQKAFVTSFLFFVSFAFAVGDAVAQIPIDGQVRSGKRDTIPTATSFSRVQNGSVRAVGKPREMRKRTLDVRNMQRNYPVPRQASSLSISAFNDKVRRRALTDTTPPSPVSVTSTASQDRVNLMWGASTDNVGVVGYKVYRDGVLIATVSTTAYSDMALPATSSYVYTVYAYDAAGNISARSASSTRYTSTTAGAVLGMNLGGIADFNSQIEFIDLMRQARPWVIGSLTTGEWDTGRTIPLDSNGYPVQVPYADPVKGQLFAQTVVVIATGGHYPAGSYTLQIRGKGKIVFQGDSPRTTYTGPGTYPIAVTPTNGGLFMSIIESDPSNPITEINLIIPGYANACPTSPFYPPFMARLQGMRTLRFMDQMATNNSQVVGWDQRRLLTSFTQAGENGIAPEYIADISNRTGTDPWINIPHQADDNYVRQLARLLKARVHSDRKIYVEYSNEVWNGIFQQSAYAAQQGAQYFALDSTGSHGQRLKFQARRSGEIFDIFEQEFGGTSRLVRVIGGWAANSWTSNFLLDALADPAINPSLKRADALAIAPYFGNEIAEEIGNANQIDSITVDEILDKADGDIATKMVDAIRSNKVIADTHGVRLVAYEGGQHLVAYTSAYQNNQTLTNKLNAANRSPRMTDMYLRMLNTWFAGSTDLFSVFAYVSVYGKYGSWGVLEWQDQDPAAAPKFSAIQQFISNGVGP